LSEFVQRDLTRFRTRRRAISCSWREHTIYTAYLYSLTVQVGLSCLVELHGPIQVMRNAHLVSA
jgi:hypothetical protein